MARLSLRRLPAAGFILLAAGSALAEPARDQVWDYLPAGVQVAWRDDPRPAAEFPAGADPAPSWGPTRRAMRRAARRGIQIEPQPPVVSDAFVPARAAPQPPPRLVPIPVETTLASPFAPPAESNRPLVHRGQPYGDDPRQRFDIHLPPECAGGGLPLVVWISGTDWKTALPADCPLDWLVDRGYVVASVGYRTTDAAIFPVPLDDCRTAITTLQRDAELWGIDPERVCVVGTAAGGHLAMLVACAEPAADVAAACAVAAPAHLPSLGGSHDRGTSPASRLVGGPLPELREAALAASPLLHVSADDPPTLIIHGRSDATTPLDQAVRLEKALAAAGVDVTLHLHDAGATLPLGPTTAAGSQLLEFLDRTLGPGRPGFSSGPSRPR
jgi:acetyl esterase/lipase